MAASIMKKEWWLVWDRVCVFIGDILVAWWVFLYVQRAIKHPASDVYGVGMAAFGVTTALSAVCFAMAVAPSSVPTSTFAGEKLLRSSILLVQTMLLVFVRDEILQMEFVRSHSFLTGLVSMLITLILATIAFGAVLAWHSGFSALHDILWFREHSVRSQQAPAIDLGADAAHGDKAEQNATPDGGKARAGEH